MLKPEESQTIKSFIKMIEGLDEETRKEAIRETNDMLEKVESVQSAAFKMPVLRRPIVQKQEADASDLFCPHCVSHEISRNGSARGLPRFVCKDCKKSFSHNYANVTYKSNCSEQKWEKFLEGMVCSDTLE